MLSTTNSSAGQSTWKHYFDKCCTFFHANVAATIRVCCPVAVFAFSHASALARPHSAQWTPAKALSQLQVNFDPRDSRDSGSWFMVHCTHSAPSTLGVKLECIKKSPYLLSHSFHCSSKSKEKVNGRSSRKKSTVSFVRLSSAKHDKMRFSFSTLL